MYQKFFGLAEAPFNLTPDSRFLYLSNKHREAMASLTYGIQQRKGFITLTGEIGSGKTTLCRALLNELDTEKTRIALIFNSYLNEIELLQTINEDYGIPAESESKKDLIKELNSFLLEENTARHNVVLIIDEAQNLAIEVLEQIRMLSNLETETDKLIQIVLMGQPELLDKLALPELEQLDQRISVRYHIYPLDEKEVSRYIRHRLFVAKAQIDIEFTENALRRIFEYSGGVPRKINVLCDRCLLAAYSKVTYCIDEDIVNASIFEVEGEKLARKKTLTESEKAGVSGSPVKMSNLLLLMPLLALVIAGGVFIGMKMAATAPYSPAAVIEGNPGESDRSDLSDGLNMSDAHAADSSGINGESREATPTPTPKDPVRTPKPYYYNWRYDERGVCRVNDPSFSYLASIITCLRLWGREVEDLDIFREMEAEVIRGVDLTDNSIDGLKKLLVDADSFDKIKTYDVPMIALFGNSPEGLAPAVVITRVEAMSCTIADPLRGYRTRRIASILESANQMIILYFDEAGLGNALKGEDSDRIRLLQEFLSEEKYYKGGASGVYDDRTARAIRNYQRYYELDATGELDPETTLLLTTRMQIMRPRLYSSGGED